MIVPVFLPHMGCTDQCIYCNQGCITDIHSRDVPRLINKTLEKIEGTYEVGLFGGNIFNIKPPVLKMLFRYFDRFSKNIINFRISTKPVPLDNEIIGILKENRVTVIELGMPVFNDIILEKLNRGYGVETFFKSFFLLKKEGFNVAIQVMVCLPDETIDDIKETARQIIRLSPHYIRIYPLVVLKDTPLHRMYNEGLFQPPPFEVAIERAIYIYLNALKQGIKTVKMGLTDNEIIKENIAAGQFHPAFGYIVKSEAFYLAVRSAMNSISINGDVLVYLNKRDIPHLIGHKRSNIERFKGQGINIAWEEKDIEAGSFLLQTGLIRTQGTIFDALPLI